MSPDGITFLDHTADVGIDVAAGSLQELLHRAALGMLALLRGEEDGDGDGDAPAGRARDPGDEVVPVRLEEAGPAPLLAAWLREILYLHEVRHLDYLGLEAERIGPSGLEGRVLAARGGRAEREIKGVTYHALEAAERDGRWTARVIFDV